MNDNHLIKCLQDATSKINTSQRSGIISKIANAFYKAVPQEDRAFLEICEQLIASHNMDLFSIATLWIKKRKSVINIKYFPIIERWLYTYIQHWGTCDQFCYRVLNPFVDTYPELFSHVLIWAESDKTYVRRAAPVSLIRVGVGIRVKSDISRVLMIVDKLKQDPEPHVQKGIGWLLKYAYQPYPQAVLDYLRAHVHILTRTAYRYALEKVPKPIKQEMMQLNYKDGTTN